MSSHNAQRLKLIYQNWRHLAKSNNTKESGKTFISPLDRDKVFGTENNQSGCAAKANAAAYGLKSWRFTAQKKLWNLIPDSYLWKYCFKNTIRKSCRLVRSDMIVKLCTLKGLSHGILSYFEHRKTITVKLKET